MKLLEVATGGALWRKAFLKFSQNSQEMTERQATASEAFSITT